jgi:death-on-curing protein
VFRHLTVEAVRAIHAEVLKAHGGSPGLRDAALLESAVAAPQASFSGEPLLKNALEAAAAYLFYLCRNHPFVDGNKRAALAACLVFLESNGLLADPGLPARNVDAWETLVLDVAASRLDRNQTTRRLAKLLKKRPGKRRP